MARFKRKFCITLLAFVLLLLIITVILKALTPEDSPISSHLGGGLFPDRKDDSSGESNNKKLSEIKMNNTVKTEKNKQLEALMGTFPPPNYYLHTFYYTWYGTPKFDGKYIHWDHPQLAHWDMKVAQNYPQGRHSPPDDIASNFYPSLGAYSSRDPSVIEDHMQQLRSASIGKKTFLYIARCVVNTNIINQSTVLNHGVSN